MSFRKQLKQAWDALAYADAGEFLPYAEKCRVLGIEPPQNSSGYLPPVERVHRRSVALNLGPELSSRTRDHALEMAQRLGAGLVLLRPAVSAPDAMVADLVARIAAQGLDHQEVAVRDPWVDSVTDLLRRRADIVCLVLGDADLNAVRRFGLKGASRRSFATPVVVVGEAPMPMPA